MVSARPGARTWKRLRRIDRSLSKAAAGQDLPTSHPSRAADPSLPLGLGVGTRRPVPCRDPSLPFGLGVGTRRPVPCRDPSLPLGRGVGTRRVVLRYGLEFQPSAAGCGPAVLTGSSAEWGSEAGKDGQALWDIRPGPDTSSKVQRW